MPVIGLYCTEAEDSPTLRSVGTFLSLSFLPLCYGIIRECSAKGEHFRGKRWKLLQKSSKQRRVKIRLVLIQSRPYCSHLRQASLPWYKDEVPQSPLTSFPFEKTGDIMLTLFKDYQEAFISFSFFFLSNQVFSAWVFVWLFV